MNLDKFTTKAQEAILAAQRLAAERNHQLIEPQHLLAALLQQADGIVPSVIAKIGALRSTLGYTRLTKSTTRQTYRYAMSRLRKLRLPLTYHTDEGASQSPRGCRRRAEAEQACY